MNTRIVLRDMYLPHSLFGKRSLLAESFWWSSTSILVIIYAPVILTFSVIPTKQLLSHFQFVDKALDLRHFP
jgi:hypothetical protein